MDQAHAQRRLVKSPPELWAELSSEDSLGRHLAEFGEIRITRVEPETIVAWEGDRASGTVEISPTGWGTKVTLAATPAVEPEPIAAEPEPIAAEPEPIAAEPEPVAAPPEPAAAQPDQVPQRGPVGTFMLRTPDTPAAATPAPEDPPRGFLARIFGLQAAEPASAPRFLQIKLPAPKAEIPTPPAPAPDPAPPVPAPDPAPPAPAPDPVPPPSIEEPPPAARGAAPLDTKRTTAILAEVLDDLGAAHHRPFSRDS